MRQRKGPGPGVSKSMSDIRVDFFLSAAGGQAAYSEPVILTHTCENQDKRESAHTQK